MSQLIKEIKRHIEWSNKQFKKYLKNDSSPAEEIIEIQSSLDQIELQTNLLEKQLEDARNLLSNRIETDIKLTNNNAELPRVQDIMDTLRRIGCRWVSEDDGQWYRFKNHMWIKLSESDLLNNELRQLYDKKSRPFVRKIIRAIAHMFYSPKLLEQLDENTNLICFENGVYDLEKDCFRDGRSDDYISLCTGYKYVEYDKNNAIVIEINDFLKKIMPKKDLRNYLMTVLSSCLSGSIDDENLYILIGNGSNGRSRLMELFEHTMGDYLKFMDNRLLTETKLSSTSY